MCGYQAMYDMYQSVFVIALFSVDISSTTLWSATGAESVFKKRRGRGGKWVERDAPTPPLAIASKPPSQACTPKCLRATHRLPHNQAYKTPAFLYVRPFLVIRSCFSFGGGALRPPYIQLFDP